MDWQQKILRETSQRFLIASDETQAPRNRVT